MNSIIPTAVKTAADKAGCNNIVYVGELDGLGYYQISVDAKGNELVAATGLPTLVSWNGETAEYVGGIVVFEILDRIENYERDREQAAAFEARLINCYKAIKDGTPMADALKQYDFTPRIFRENLKKLTNRK